MHASRRLALIAGLSGAAVLLAGCTGSANNGGGESSETLTLGISVAPQSWDPALVGDSNYIPYAQAAYDSLIRREPTGEYVPMLATEWSNNEDNTVFSLTLRDDVTFSDGSEFNADVVKANMEQFQQANGPLVNQLAGLEEIEVVDETHVNLYFSTPNPDIVYGLADAAGRMAAPDAIGTDGINTVPVGSGPYVLDEAKTVQGTTYTFSAREDYWDPSLQNYGTLIFRVYADETGLLNALQSGQVDAGNLSSQDNIAAAKAAGIDILNPDARLAWAGLILFDHDGSEVPALADQRVRQAIATVVDRQEFLDVVFSGNGVVTQQMYSPGFEGWDAAVDETYATDVAAAQALMAEAGYADGFSLRMPLVEGFTLPSVQSALEEYLGELNISIEWVSTPGTSFVGDLLGGKFPASYMFLGAPTPWAAIQNFIAPTAPWNTDKTDDPELTALIDSIPSGSDEERAEAYADINVLMAEYSWYVPFIMVDENYAVNKGVEVELQLGNNVPYIYNYSPTA